MSLEGSVTTWIGQLRVGDPTAAQKLWERYFQQLVGLNETKKVLWFSPVVWHDGSPPRSFPTVVKAHPKDTASWSLLRQHYGLLAELLVRFRKPADAMHAVLEMAGIFPERWEGPYDAACFLARSVALVGQGVRLSTSLGEKWIQTYRHRTLVLLRQAIQNGFKDINLLTKAPELDPLRSQPGFQQLVAELGAKAKTGRP